MDLEDVSHLHQSGKRMITPAQWAEMEVYVGKPYVIGWLSKAIWQAEFLGAASQGNRIDPLPSCVQECGSDGDCQGCKTFFSLCSQLRHMVCRLEVGASVFGFDIVGTVKQSTVLQADNDDNPTYHILLLM